MNRALIIVLLVMVVAIAAWAYKTVKNDGFETVDVDTFERMIAAHDSIQLLDVRSEDEYEEGHLPGATLINIQDSTFLDQVEKQLVKEKPIAVYCRSGRRSANAASKLVKAGYKVINLDGGIIAWRKQGKTVFPNRDN
jgi:rhodanese-related sulfurtransferase